MRPAWRPADDRQSFALKFFFLKLNAARRAHSERVASEANHGPQEGSAALPQTFFYNPNQI